MSSLKFGTSGLRGLVTDLVGWPTYAYTLAFLRACAAGIGSRRGKVLLGRDLRRSSPDMLRYCLAAAQAAGFEPVDCGEVPTPALALAALQQRCPAVMITGSHIPDDRNGLKFYSRDGEITKADEALILREFEAVGAEGHSIPPLSGAVATLDAITPYIERYTNFFAPDALTGLSVGVFQHSSVARDILVELVERLGATATSLAWSDTFIPVDTEAHRAEDIDAIAAWGASNRFDAIVSTDGDGDRPLVADENGTILRGDALGLLTARFLGLSTVVTPVTSSSAMERSGIAKAVTRTRVGSPFVIAGIEEALSAGASGVVGFEPNGGLLLGSEVGSAGRRLPALMTRDSALPILSVLAASRREHKTVSRLVADLKAGHAFAYRLQDIPSDKTSAFLARLGSDADYRTAFFAPVGQSGELSVLDGVRTVLGDGSVVHFRGSGNAPELRCYVEAGSVERGQSLLDWGLREAGKAVED